MDQVRILGACRWQGYLEVAKKPVIQALQRRPLLNLTTSALRLAIFCLLAPTARNLPCIKVYSLSRVRIASPQPLYVPDCAPVMRSVDGGEQLYAMSSFSLSQREGPRLDSPPTPWVNARCSRVGYKPQLQPRSLDHGCWPEAQIHYTSLAVNCL